jgi:hypothetical protein
MKNLLSAKLALPNNFNVGHSSYPLEEIEGGVTI